MVSRSDVAVRVRKVIEIFETMRVNGKTISRDGIPMREASERHNSVLEMFESGTFKAINIGIRTGGDEVSLSLSRRSSGTLKQTEYSLEQIESMLAGQQFDAVSKDKAIQATQIRFIEEARVLLDALEKRVKQGHDCGGYGEKLIDDLDQLRRQIWRA